MTPKKTRENLYNYSDGKEFKGRSPRDIFTLIYRSNLWENAQSVSGHGATPEQTGEIVRLLPEVLRGFGIKTMLDIPCGDFNWMQKTDLSGVEYTGGDIVEELIATNRQRYATAGVRFEHFDLLQQPLGPFDLVFCRDCLVHFSFEDIRKALENIRQSGSRYLMTTTFESQSENTDIPTGGWRPLNFRLPPFSFPEPLYLLDEKCTEWDGVFSDKCLGIWEISNL